MSHSLDSPERAKEIRNLLSRKRSLRSLYAENYRKYCDVLSRVPENGLVLELGSGAGFVKEFIPEMITSDVTAYEGVDQVIDATHLPFQDHALRAVFMVNVLHHIADAKAFFDELSRCLMIHGRALIVDHYPGYPAKWIYKYLHHEPYHPESTDWNFQMEGPLSSANAALAWIIFFRDRKRFESDFPSLKIEKIRTHTPFRYWLSGGLKSWSLLPGPTFPLATAVDQWLIGLSPEFGSFMDIELLRV